MESSATFLSYLAGLTVRSLALFFMAGAAILLLRVKSAAARHAIWTVTAAGMLLLAAFAPLMPPLPVRVLSAAGPAEVVTIPDSSAPESASSEAALVAAIPARPPATPWRQMLAGIYLAGAAILLLRLSFGYLFTARLVRASHPAPDAGGDCFESSWISVPLTVGWLHPRILLPEDWREWEPAKLRAVLTHEQTHVQRGDWLIALLAGLNRCFFWFHPAAWWLERQLAMLAEQACDDEALLQLGGRETYAQALLDMAAAVKRGGGRLVWEAMAMARASEVRMRIERILDETRQVSQGVSRLRWAALLTCSLPLIYVASVAQLAPARAQEQPQIAHTAKAERPDFAQMEQFVATHPDDLDARSKLIRDYFLYSIKQPRLNHIFWMIQNHPESDLTALNSTGILPRTSATNDEADYQTAAGLWRQQIAIHAGDAHVLANAARFLGQPGGDPDEAERLLTQARSLDSHTNSYTQQLGRLYFNSLLANAGDPAFPAGPANPGFAAKTRSELEASTDSALLSNVGSQLSLLGRSPNAFGTAQVDLAAHPAIADLVDLGNRLVARARPLNAQQMPVFAVPRQNRSMQNAPAPPAPPPLAPMAAGTEPKPATPQMIRVGGLVQANNLATKIQPVYPQAARDAGIQGTVELQIVIAKEGTVESTQVIDGNPILAAAAQQAVMQWLYKPTLLNGDPVKVTTSVSIPFNLQ